MSDDRKDEGGLAVLIAAGCLVVIIGVFTLFGIQAKQQAALAVAAAKLSAADEEAAVSESK